MNFSVTAFMPVYNEADILPWSLKHLQEQSVQVYVIDNWSTDGSDTIAQSFPLAGFERFPASGPTEYYEWRKILKRVEELAAASTSDWCMLQDPDEIRRADWFCSDFGSLRGAFEDVGKLGYNAVDFKVAEFWAVDDTWPDEAVDMPGAEPESHFRYFASPLEGNLPHVKAWRNVGRVELAVTGGHMVWFKNMRTFPQKFILKHYPIRSTAQGTRKLEDRFRRWDPAERAQRWHEQYDELNRTKRFIRKPEDLKVWG